ASSAFPIKFVESVFAVQTLVFLLIAGVVAFAIGMSIGQVTLHDTAGDAAVRALEASILTILGGFLARLFIALLLSSVNPGVGGQIAIGWAFFLVPGAVDSLAMLFTGHPVTTPGVFLWLAMIIGAF